MCNKEQITQLDHLHDTIQRLATNSFTVKGWAVTVASGFLGFSIKDAKPAVAFIGLVPIIIFWIIDSYYLAGERFFRARYNETLGDGPLRVAPITGQVVTRVGLFHALRTPVVAALYLTLIFCSVLLGVGLVVVPK